MVLFIILLFLRLASFDCPCFIHGYDAVQELTPFSEVAFQVKGNECVLVPYLHLNMMQS